MQVGSDVQLGKTEQKLEERIKIQRIVALPRQVQGRPVCRDPVFGKGERVLASVIGVDGRAGGWITRDRLRVEDAVFAFSEAEDISA